MAGFASEKKYGCQIVALQIYRTVDFATDILQEFVRVLDFVNGSAKEFLGICRLQLSKGRFCAIVAQC